MPAFMMAVPTPIDVITTLTFAQINGPCVQLGGSVTPNQIITFPSAADLWARFSNPVSGLAIVVLLFNDSTQTWVVHGDTGSTEQLSSGQISSTQVRFMYLTLISSTSYYLWF